MAVPNNFKQVFVFRVDASVEMGSGHVMRCLTLANALRIQNILCYFICREHSGNLCGILEKQGYTVFRMPMLALSNKGLSGYERWLGVDYIEDAKQTIQILESKLEYVSWLVVDHYGVDQSWETLVRSYTKRIMVIDDLANRVHNCDLLLDQTYGRREYKYCKLLPSSCETLLGANYSLLRPEFAQYREASLRKRVTPTLKKLLVSMGGMDAGNITGQILQALSESKYSRDFEVTIILGELAPHVEEVKQLAQLMPFPTSILSGVDNMAAVMSDMDLAVGAAGSTTWERCCLGLPCIQVLTAENQTEIISTLESVNAIIRLYSIDDLELAISKALSQLKKMSVICSVVTDGQGVNRVTNSLLGDNSFVRAVSLSPVSENDKDFLFSLQTEGSRRYAKNSSIPSYSEHCSWFSMIFNSADSVIFLVLFYENKAGMVRLDNLVTEEDIELSIIVAAEFSRQRIALQALQLLMQLLPETALTAYIHNENIASRRLFGKLGFSRDSLEGDFGKYTVCTNVLTQGDSSVSITSFGS